MASHESARALRRVIQGAVVGAAAAVLAAALWLPGATGGFEAKTWDLRARLLARPGAATGQVATILLDQQSLNWGKNENGWPWPWPREVYAAVASFCKRGGAKALVFDLILTEPSAFGVSDDQAFGQGVAENGRVVGVMNLADSARGGHRVAWRCALASAHRDGADPQGARFSPGAVSHTGAFPQCAGDCQHEPSPGPGGRGLSQRAALQHVCRQTGSVGVPWCMACRCRPVAGSVHRPRVPYHWREASPHRCGGQGAAALPRPHPDALCPERGLGGAVGAPDTGRAGTDGGSGPVQGQVRLLRRHRARPRTT